MEETLSIHDSILGGILNYIDVQTEFPEQDKLLRKSMADKFREMWKIYPKTFIPFIGSAIRNHYRYQVFNTKLIRNGELATIRDDIKNNAWV